MGKRSSAALPMRLVAYVLLVAVFLRHGAIYWIADLSGFSPAAASYILGGLLEAALAGVIALFLVCHQVTLHRNLAIIACAIAALEGLQMAGCRAAISSIASVPFGRNLCDHLTGLPVGAVAFTLYLALVCYAIGASIRWR